MAQKGEIYLEREIKIREQELELKSQELEIRRKELSEKASARTRSYTSPLTVALFTTAFGLVTTAVSIAWQARINNSLEERKMEYSLIQSALADANKKQALRNIKFLQETELITLLPEDKLKKITLNPEKAPSFAGSVIRDDIISIYDAKTILKQQGVYDGPPDNNDDHKLREAVAKFQMKRGKVPDGLLGPCTLRELWAAAAPLPNANTAASDKTLEPCKSQ